MSNDPYTDGAANSPTPSDTGAAPEWNGGFAPQQPDVNQNYQQAPQQPQPQQPWSGGFAPQQPDVNQGYQQAAPQQPQPQQPWNGGYAPQQAPQGYQQAPYQGGYQQARPPRQPRAPRTPNPAYSVVKLPRFVKKEKLPALVKVLLCAFAGLSLLILLNNICLFNGVWTNLTGYNYSMPKEYKALEIIADLLVLGGAVCLVLGAFLKKSLLSGIGALVTGGGVLMAAIGYMITVPSNLRWMDIIAGVLFIFAAAALVLIGLNYLLHGRGINAMIKRIACYAGFGCAVVGTILSLIPTLEYLSAVSPSLSDGSYTIMYGELGNSTVRSGYNAAASTLYFMKSTGTVLWTVFTLLASFTLAAALFLYNPDMQMFQEDAPQASKAPLQMWRATAIAKIMASVFTGCTFIALIFAIINFKFVIFFALLLWLAAGVMMLLGTLLSRKCEFLYAIGVFLAAAGILTFMLGDSWYGALLLFVQLLCMLAIGFHYLLKGSPITETKKNISTFLGLGLGAAVSVFHLIMLFVDTSKMGMSISATGLILHLFILFSAVALFLAILFYKPFSAPKAYPANYGNGYPGGYPGGYGNGYQNNYGNNSNNNNGAAPY